MVNVGDESTSLGPLGDLWDLWDLCHHGDGDDVSKKFQGFPSISGVLLQPRGSDLQGQIPTRFVSWSRGLLEAIHIWLGDLDLSFRSFKPMGLTVVIVWQNEVVDWSFEPSHAEIRCHPMWPAFALEILSSFFGYVCDYIYCIFIFIYIYTYHIYHINTPYLYIIYVYIIYICILYLSYVYIYIIFIYHIYISYIYIYIYIYNHNHIYIICIWYVYIYRYHVYIYIHHIIFI